MFFSLIAKYGQKLLGILIVVAIVVAVFIINPWNMFGDGLKTHHTANNITAIREIGQLITAEYYGEVISTIDQSRLKMIYADDVNARANIVFQQLKQDLLTVYANQVEKMEQDSDKKEGFWTFKWFRKAKKERKESIENIELTLESDEGISKDSLYPLIVEYFWMYKTNSSLKPEAKLDDKDKKTTLWLLLQDIKDKAENSSDKEFDLYMRAEIPEFNNQVFSDYYYQKKRDVITRKENKKELSMIGRGWVKAGFNFEKLDESNFFFDQKAGIVHLFGVHAEILNADINPWFIPEKKIPGFQIIEANRHVDFYDAVKVKTYCVEKLRKMALDAGILQQAEKEGKEALKSFIGLLSEVEVKEVYFHYDVFSVYSKEILSDMFISYSEARMLDTLIENQLNEIVSLDTAKTNHLSNQQLKEVKIHQLKASISQFKKCWFEEQGWYYNRLAATVFRVSSDSILCHSEYDELLNYRWSLQTALYNEGNRIYLENNVWYDNELEFINEYNKAISEIENKTKYYADRHDTIFNNNTELNTFTTSKNIKSSEILAIKNYESNIVLSYIDNIHSDTLINDLKYPIRVAYNWKDLLYEKVNISSLEGMKKVKEKDSIKLGKAILDQAEIDTNLYEKNIVVSVSRQDDNSWMISDSLGFTQEKETYLEYLINYYKQNNAFGFFTKANRSMKKAIDHNNVQEKLVEAKKEIKSVFN